MFTSGRVEILDELFGTDDKSWYRRRSDTVSVGTSDSFRFSHAVSYPTIRIDSRFVSCRSPPAIRVRYRLIDSTDSIDETFELRPMSSSESAYDLQGWTEIKNTGNE